MWGVCQAARWFLDSAQVSTTQVRLKKAQDSAPAHAGIEAFLFKGYLGPWLRSATVQNRRGRPGGGHWW